MKIKMPNSLAFLQQIQFTEMLKFNHLTLDNQTRFHQSAFWIKFKILSQIKYSLQVIIMLSRLEIE